MLSIDPWNILWTVVNLLVLYVIFKKFLFQPVMNVIQAREDMVRQQFDNAKKDQDEASKMKAEYHEKLEHAKEEADQIILDARARAESEHAKTLERARDEAEHMLEKAKVDIANEQEKATKAAQTEISKLALMAARKIVETGDAYDTGSNQ